MTKAIRQDPDYPLIMINAAGKQFKVANWLTARNLYDLARRHVACSKERKSECEDMIREIDRIMGTVTFSKSWGYQYQNKTG